MQYMYKFYNSCQTSGYSVDDHLSALLDVRLKLVEGNNLSLSCDFVLYRLIFQCLLLCFGSFLRLFSLLFLVFQLIRLLALLFLHFSILHEDSAHTSQASADDHESDEEVRQVGLDFLRLLERNQREN